jgi:hypothetical protein
MAAVISALAACSAESLLECVFASVMFFTSVVFLNLTQLDSRRPPACSHDYCRSLAFFFARVVLLAREPPVRVLHTRAGAGQVGFQVTLKNDTKQEVGVDSR